MSPWNMMDVLGVSTLAACFAGKAYVFKALALGAPNFKTVCVRLALMIPGIC